MKVAALYVQTGGCYFGLRNVVPFDVSDDALLALARHSRAAQRKAA